MSSPSTVFTQFEYLGYNGVAAYSWIQPPREPVSTFGVAPSPSKGHFEGNLRIAYLDGHDWKLLEPFSYVSATGETYTAPEGMITDFASIPRILWNILPPTGDYGPAAVIHDKLCYEVKTASDRDKADLLFYEMLGVLGVGSFKRWVLYRGVRIGAWWDRLEN